LNHLTYILFSVYKYQHNKKTIYLQVSKRNFVLSPMPPKILPGTSGGKNTKILLENDHWNEGWWNTALYLEMRDDVGAMKQDEVTNIIL